MWKGVHSITIYLLLATNWSFCMDIYYLLATNFKICCDPIIKNKFMYLFIAIQTMNIHRLLAIGVDFSFDDVEVNVFAYRIILGVGSANEKWRYNVTRLNSNAIQYSKVYNNTCRN